MSTMEMRKNRFCGALKSSLTGLSCCLMMLLVVFHLQHTQPSSSTESVTPSNVSFHYYIDEDVIEGSVIADLSVDFTRVYHVDEEERHQLTFLVFDQSAGVATKLFDVDKRTGVLSTTTTTTHGRRLDREELCDGLREECVLTFDVVVQPYFQMMKVKVEIVDVNDNAPVIELADGGVQLYESASLDTELHVGVARDLDSQRHGVESCHLSHTRSAVNTNTDDKTFFSLVVTRRLDDVRAVDLYVRLTSTLDREIDGDFLVTMRVSSLYTVSPRRDPGGLCNVASLILITTTLKSLQLSLYL